MSIAVEMLVCSFSGNWIFLRDADVKGLGAEEKDQSGNYGVSYHEL